MIPGCGGKLFAALVALGGAGADELDDLVGAGPGGEDLGDAELLQLGDVVGRDRAADRDQDVVDALLA